jgi:hypothetical protein
MDVEVINMADITQRRFAVMGDNIFAICEKLLKNQKILKLLKFTDKNPLDHEDLTEDEADELLHKNILISPKIPDDDTIKQSYIIVLLDNFTIDPVNQDFKVTQIRFDAICPLDEWVLNDKSLRPYLIMSEIDSEFNEKALKGVGNLSFSGANRLVVSSYLGGYSMKYGQYEFN